MMTRKLGRGNPPYWSSTAGRDRLSHRVIGVRGWSRVLLLLTQQLFRVECPVGRFFVLEICKDIAVVGQVLLEFRCVLLAFFLGIFAFAQAVVAEVCGDDVRALEFFAFGDAQRGIKL